MYGKCLERLAYIILLIDVCRHCFSICKMERHTSCFFPAHWHVKKNERISNRNSDFLEERKKFQNSTALMLLLLLLFFTLGTNVLKETLRRVYLWDSLSQPSDYFMQLNQW